MLEDGPTAAPCGLTSSRMPLPTLLLTVSLALSITALGPMTVASAQDAIERNLPSAPASQPASVTIDEQDFGEPDPAPLGVDLSGVRLIGETDAVSARPARGITGAPEGISPTAIDGALAPFIGEPMSLKLIADIQAAIATVYRDAGYPFVSVTLPPQEITSGVLQVRVIEFRAGEVAVGGTTQANAGRIRTGLRIVPGDRINAPALSEDLTWLNRSPFQTVEGVFRPGSETALSDLGVTVTEETPISIFAGWSNTGSKATGRDRFYVGFDASLQPLNGAWMSYQLTGSKTYWENPQNIAPSTGDYPSYLSHAARFVFPTLPRQALEIAPVWVISREEADEFVTFENTTFELPLLYRSAVSNFLPGQYLGDIYGGLEFKRVERTTFFDDFEVASGDAEIFQIVLGWTDMLDDPYGRTFVDASLTVNPGNVLSGNSDATWSAFTNGRVDDITYVYGSASLARISRLPDDFALVSSVTGIVAGQSLPETERISIGGSSAVRGYNFGDVSVDAGIYWRNELRLPEVSVIGATGGFSDLLTPFLFADFGHGRDIAVEESTSIAGVGAGLDYVIGEYFIGNVLAGYALADAGMTDAGDWTFHASIKARF